MVRSSCLAEKFLSVEEVGAQAHVVRFSKQDEYEPVYEGEGDERQPTGEYQPTGRVTYNEEIVYGPLTPGKVLALRLQELEAYDTSDAVNSFTYNGVERWIPRADRELFQKRLDNERKWGNDTVTLLFDGTLFTLGIEEADALLDAVEHYATRCFDVTTRHKMALSVLETVEDLLAYDITAGYPEKLVLGDAEF